MIIRWVCEKDNKKWIYPIDKCIYCKGPIKKTVSREAKVMGITRVNIPSPMHPIIPYNVILLEDEHGNRMPKKTMKDYKIGDTYKISRAKTKDAVIISKIKYDLKEALEEAINLLESYDIVNEDKILIKPSVTEPAYSYMAVNTNPNLLESLIEILKEKGISNILVAEQATPGNDVVAAAMKSGLIDVCKKQGVEFKDLCKAEYSEKDYEGFKFKIARDFLERKVINVPVMKTNSQIAISGAMENMIRAVDTETQKRMFAEDIEKTLPKLMKVMPGVLTIGDATIGMQGQGPTSLGEPAFLNMLFVGKEPAIIDAVFCSMAMLEVPDYLKGIDLKSVEIIGEDLEAVKLNLIPANKGLTGHSRIKLIDGKADPETLNSALKLSSKLIGLAGYETNIAIGRFITEDMTAGKDRIIAYGQDAISRLKSMGVATVAELHEKMQDMEKLMLVKSILENSGKKSINLKDKVKSKISNIGMRIKKSL